MATSTSLAVHHERRVKSAKRGRRERLVAPCELVNARLSFWWTSDPYPAQSRAATSWAGAPVPRRLQGWPGGVQNRGAAYAAPPRRPASAASPGATAAALSELGVAVGKTSGSGLHYLKCDEASTEDGTAPRSGADSVSASPTRWCSRLFTRQRPGRPLVPPPMRSENPCRRRADAGEAWCGSESPCDSVAQEPVEPLIAAMSAKARLIPGRLLPAAHTAPSTEEPASHS